MQLHSSAGDRQQTRYSETDHALERTEGYAEYRAERGNVSDGVDIWRRVTRENPFEMMTLGKDLNAMKREPVNVWRQRGLVQRP